MAEVIKFTATKLAGTNKVGVIKPDSDGYYTMVIGGLNAFNSVGEYYTLEGARQLFEGSSALMRRIKNGCLKGETGHPKFEEVLGANKDERIQRYMQRILAIDERNTCCFFREVWLDPDYGKTHPEFKNPNLVAIMAKIKPAGPRGAALEAAFNNPGENVCFSIRALTRDYYQRGTNYRVLQNIVTWDWVTEPGLANATAFSSPALESLGEKSFMMSDLEHVVDDLRKNSLALESDRVMAMEALEAFKLSYQVPAAPLFTRW
jgi:hypothetical protein